MAEIGAAQQNRAGGHGLRRVALDRAAEEAPVDAPAGSGARVAQCAGPDVSEMAGHVHSQAPPLRRSAEVGAPGVAEGATSLGAPVEPVAARVCSRSGTGRRGHSGGFGARYEGVLGVAAALCARSRSQEGSAAVGACADFKCLRQVAPDVRAGECHRSGGCARGVSSEGVCARSFFITLSAPLLIDEQHRFSVNHHLRFLSLILSLLQEIHASAEAVKHHDARVAAEAEVRELRKQLTDSASRMRAVLAATAAEGEYTAQLEQELDRERVGKIQATEAAAQAVEQCRNERANQASMAMELDEARGGWAKEQAARTRLASRAAPERQQRALLERKAELASADLMVRACPCVITY